MKWISFFLSMSALFINAAFGVYKPHVIYGDDNRQDLYEVQHVSLAEAARSTAAMIAVASLTQEGSIYKVLSAVYGEEYSLCSEEKFFSQPTAAMCSGFLVGQDLVATAGHCLSEVDCKDWAFVFNYAMRSEGDAPQTVGQDDVYFCSSIVAHSLTDKEDFALVKLDRPVVGYQPLKLASQSAQALDEIVVVGHPAGLPTKVSAGAQVRSTNPEYFVANLDTYGGNSGSAVFNAATMEVMGILVRGERDFSYNVEKGCYNSNYCLDGECRGEDVTNISYIRESLESTGVTYLE